MKYLLKNKDNIIFKFEVINIEKFYKDKKFFILDINNIEICSKLIPLNIDIVNLKNSLKEWIKNRKAPNNRHYIEKIIETYSYKKESDFMDYIDVSLGLSLNDTFWIIPEIADYKWKDYNLYENKFEKALELVAFIGDSHKISGITSSPEYTTNGMLKKCWHRENNEIFLYKGSTSQFANGGKEAYSEYYLAQVATKLGIDCIKYDLKKFHNEIVSSCKIFTNQKQGYYPIYYFLNEEEIKADKIELLNIISKIYTEEKLNDILLFDAIIYNSDRHLSNFGMLVNNDSLEIIKPAPIFDNGSSIINYLTEKELTNIEEVFKNKKSFFEISFDEQLEISLEKRHFNGLLKLINFKFKRHPLYNLPGKWLIPIEEHIQQRAIMGCKFLIGKYPDLIKNLSKNLENDITTIFNKQK